VADQPTPEQLAQWLEKLEKCIRAKVEAWNEALADIDRRLTALEDGRD
jgi:hypothetical protein